MGKRLKGTKRYYGILLAACLMLGGCGAERLSSDDIQPNSKAEASTSSEKQTEDVNTPETNQTEKVDNSTQGTEEVDKPQTDTEKPASDKDDTDKNDSDKNNSDKGDKSDYKPAYPSQDGVGIEYEIDADAPWIAIDAGHQKRGNNDKEPIGPGASEKKAKVSSGTEGRYTGVPEYELTLKMALRLRDALIEEGYNVLMIRETNNVDISNAQRAMLANEKGVAAFVRLHADGVDNTSVSGITTLCQTKNNEFCSSTYKESRKLSDALSKQMTKATGAKNRGVSEVDNMSGINWCEVPVSIVEMGFMTNEEEDRLMQTEDYQAKLVDGMVAGINAFCGR